MPIRKLTAFCTLILSFAVANCAIVPGPRGAGSGSVSGGSRIAMLNVTPTEGATAAIAQDAVRRVLIAQGFQVAARGDLIADVSFAVRERTIGFSGATKGSDGATHLDSQPQKGDAFSLCHSRIGRITISILDDASKKLVFKGAAEDLFCGEPDEAKLLSLASVALRDIRNRVAAR